MNPHGNIDLFKTDEHNENILSILNNKNVPDEFTTKKPSNLLRELDLDEIFTTDDVHNSFEVVKWILLKVNEVYDYIFSHSDDVRYKHLFAEKDVRDSSEEFFRNESNHITNFKRIYPEYTDANISFEQSYDKIRRVNAEPRYIFDECISTPTSQLLVEDTINDTDTTDYYNKNIMLYRMSVYYRQHVKSIGLLRPNFASPTILNAYVLTLMIKHFITEKHFDLIDYPHKDITDDDVYEQIIQSDASESDVRLLMSAYLLSFRFPKFKHYEFILESWQQLSNGGICAFWSDYIYPLFYNKINTNIQFGFVFKEIHDLHFSFEDRASQYDDVMGVGRQMKSVSTSYATALTSYATAQPPNANINANINIAFENHIGLINMFNQYSFVLGNFAINYYDNTVINVNSLLSCGFVAPFYSRRDPLEKIKSLMNSSAFVRQMNEITNIVCSFTKTISLSRIKYDVNKSEYDLDTTIDAEQRYPQHYIDESTLAMTKRLACDEVHAFATMRVDLDGTELKSYLNSTSVGTNITSIISGIDRIQSTKPYANHMSLLKAGLYGVHVRDNNKLFKSIRHSEREIIKAHVVNYCAHLGNYMYRGLLKLLTDSGYSDEQTMPAINKLYGLNDSDEILEHIDEDVFSQHQANIETLYDKLDGSDGNGSDGNNTTNHNSHQTTSLKYAYWKGISVNPYSVPFVVDPNNTTDDGKIEYKSLSYAVDGPCTLMSGTFNVYSAKMYDNPFISSDYIEDLYVYNTPTIPDANSTLIDLARDNVRVMRDQTSANNIMKQYYKAVLGTIDEFRDVISLTFTSRDDKPDLSDYQISRPIEYSERKIRGGGNYRMLLLVIFAMLIIVVVITIIAMTLSKWSKNNINPDTKI
jgi:hypothetical protein